MSLEEKQNYLRTEIVEKGYNAEKFYEFWQTYNLDLQDASIDNIISVVNLFIQQEPKNEITEQETQQEEDEFGDYVEIENHTHVYNDLDWDFLAGKTTPIPVPHPNSANEEPPKPTPKTTKPPQIIKETQLDLLSPSTPELQSQSHPKPQLEPQSQIIPNATFNEVLENSLSTTRKCLKLQPNILEHHINIDIQINNFKEITEENSGIINKLWKGTYILFTIKTVGRNKQKSIGISWEVHRQHSDFEWLRNMLIKMYPGIVVPPLPNAIKDLTQINGYIRKLVSFLADCENCKELKNSKYFEVFLSYGASKDFEGFKKSCETTSKPKNLSHIINMTGELELLHSQKIESYSSGLQSFLTKTSQHLKKEMINESSVKSIIGQIDDLYSQISNKYKELSSMFTTMSEESCEFSDQECYPKLTETYKQISQLSTQHSFLCNSEREFISTFMSSHFSYEKDRINNMQNLINKHKTFTVELNKPKHQSDKPVVESGPSMFGKIANLFGEKTESLDIPATDTTTLRDQVGFYNSQLLKESIRCIEGMTSSHINHFSLYGHSRIDNIEEIQKMWSQILVDLSKLKV